MRNYESDWDERDGNACKHGLPSQAISQLNEGLRDEVFTFRGTTAHLGEVLPSSGQRPREPTVAARKRIFKESIINKKVEQSNMARVSVFGLGYVGAVTAACLAHKGHEVIGVDTNPVKVDMVASGQGPVLEPRLEDLIVEAREAAKLHATTDVQSAIHQSEVSFICVGTPSLYNGCLDLSSIKRSCHDIGEALRSKKDSHVIVIRSTVLPGTCRSFVIPVIEAASKKSEGMDFAVCSNPEFTREGCAVADFLNPAITVLGSR